MIDIHNHSAWGLDDGPATPEDTLSMLRIAATDGITEVVFTPHFNADYIFKPDLLSARKEALQGQNASTPAVCSGCEFQITLDNLDALLACPTTFTINQGRYLLLELPCSHVAAYTESVMHQLLKSGIVPIIAHPERNPVLMANLSRLESWVEMGCLTQITAFSVTGGFGGGARSAATRLLSSGLVHVVASDAHDPQYRPPVLSLAYRAISRSFGEQTADLLFTDNPGCIVRDDLLAGGKTERASHSRWNWLPFDLARRHAS